MFFVDKAEDLEYGDYLKQEDGSFRRVVDIDAYFDTEKVLVKFSGDENDIECLEYGEDKVIWRAAKEDIDNVLALEAAEKRIAVLIEERDQYLHNMREAHKKTRKYRELKNV